MKDKYIQIKDASKILGVSKLTLRNWDNSSKLKALRHPINNYRVYKREDVDKILKDLEAGFRHPNTWKKRKKEEQKPKDKVYTLKVLHLKD